MFSKKFYSACLILLLPLSFLLVIFYPGLIKTIYSQETILFQDSFDIKTDISKWNVKSGVWSAPQNRLVGEAYGFNQSGQIEIRNSDWNHFRLEFDAYFILGVDFIIKTRDSQNGYYSFNFRSNAGGRFNTPEIIIQRHEINNFKEILKTKDIDVPRNFQKNRIIIEQQGTHIFVKLNNNIIYDGYDDGSNIHQGAISLNYATGADGETKTQIDNVIVYQLPAPIPTSTPTPSPSATPTGKIPLIFIPGFGGSELQTKQEVIWSQPDGHGGTYNNHYNKNDKVWLNTGKAALPGEDDYFDILRLNSDGDTEAADLELTNTTFNYDQLVNFFTTNGYTLNQDFFIFNYDWRKDFHKATNELSSKITDIKNTSGQPKVDIITHSAGGLIARKYISEPNNAVNVRKLFTITPPHLGAVKFIQYLRFGGCLTLNPLLESPICAGISPTALKDVLQNFRGGYQLIPSQKYYYFYDGSKPELVEPYADAIDIDNDKITGSLSYHQTKNLLSNLNYNTILYDTAETFHSMDDSLSNTNGVDVTIFAGSGLSTTGQIIERSKTNWQGKSEKVHEIYKINGDETVPLFSASLDDPINNRSLKGSARVLYVKAAHGEAPNKGSVLNQIKNLLSDNTQLVSGIQTESFKLQGKLFGIFSPVNIHAYDNHGNHTGPLVNGDYEANIPGSSYTQLENDKFIWLPDDQTYTIKMESTGEGSFDFKITDYDNDKPNKTTYYKEIPLTPNTKAELLVLSGLTQSPNITLDTDGNNQADKYVVPFSTITGDATFDTTAPETKYQIDGTKGTNNWYKSNLTITLNSTDNNNGSGVNQILYSINNQPLQTYSNPITISTEGSTTIKFHAIDNLGNIENEQQIDIKIDKSAPEANITFNTKTQNFDITGIDNLTQKTTNTESIPGEIVITDEAGNTTKLIVTPKDRKLRDEINIKSINYNNSIPLIMSNNRFISLIIKDHNNKVYLFDQRIIIQNQERLSSNYLWITNRSRIVSTINKKRSEQYKLGITYLKITTQKGQLLPSF